MSLTVNSARRHSTMERSRAKLDPVWTISSTYRSRYAMSFPRRSTKRVVSVRVAVNLSLMTVDGH